MVRDNIDMDREDRDNFSEKNRKEDIGSGKAEIKVSEPPLGFFQRHFTSRIKHSDVGAFCRQLSVLIDVGIPLLESLEIAAKRTTHPYLKEIIKSLARGIEVGGLFSSALMHYPAVFSKLFVNMIMVAEKGGSLDKALRILADYLEKEAEVRSKIKKALTYPVVTFGIGIIVVVIVLTYVTPTFAKFFLEGATELPWPTLALISLGDSFRYFWWIYALVIIGGYFLIRFYNKTKGGRQFFDMIKLRLPLFGPLLTKVSVARSSQTMGTLLLGGVGILNALKITHETVGNTIYEKAFLKTYEAVEEGQRVADTLRETNVMPPFAMDLIAIGEEAGRLGEMFTKVSETYQVEIDRTIDNFTAFLEPVLLVVMGGLVALIAYSVFLPYFSLGQVLFK